jgi:acetylornithine deacetylase/succinyl-diaminopimelate desuccinylase-like protein
MRDAVRSVRAQFPAAAAGAPARRAAEPALQVAGWLGDTASFGAKVPTVIFGPGGEPVYCPDEHLSVADIIEATQVYTSFAVLALARPGA